MGNCLPNCPFRKPTPKTIVLLLVGLDNAGKTSTINNLKGEPVYNTVLPTVGFSSIILKHKNYLVKIYDLGGSQQIRGIWHRYFSDAHGIIFVIDASDSTRLDEGKEILITLLSNEKIQQKPILLLANKQDQEGALDEMDIVENLQIEDLVNTYKCKARVETCSAKSPNSKSCSFNKRPRVDPGINLGFRWLVNCIIDDFDNLNYRVINDMQAQEYLQKAERQARFKRISEFRKQNMNSNEQNNDSDEDFNKQTTLEDPFKPISHLVKNNKVNDVEKKRVIHVRSQSSAEDSIDTVESLSENTKVNEKENSSYMTDFVANQLKLSASLKRRKFKVKSNKTAPLTNALCDSSKLETTSNTEIFTISSNELISKSSNIISLPSNSEAFSDSRNDSTRFIVKRPASAKSLDIQKHLSYFHNTNNTHNQESSFSKSAEDSGFVSPRRTNSNHTTPKNSLTLPSRPKSAGNIYKPLKIQDILSPRNEETSPSSSKQQLPNRGF